MKKYLVIIGSILFVLVVVFFLQSLIRDSIGIFTRTATVKFNDKALKLEIVDDPKTREIGLSEKKSLGKDSGMLFVFETAGIYPFWMKDMSFPIDIIFLNGNKIVTIYANVPAPKKNSQSLLLYPPKEPADKVIELNAGKAKEYDLHEGQTLEIKL